MPENSADYSQEIDNGKNLRSVICKFCTSIILTPSTASFSSFEVSNMKVGSSGYKVVKYCTHCFVYSLICL